MNQRFAPNNLYTDSHVFDKYILTAYQRLGCAILCQVIKDIDENQYQGEIVLFMESSLFKSIVKAIDLKPDNIRQKLHRINSASKPSVRNPYRSGRSTLKPY